MLMLCFFFFLIVKYAATEMPITAVSLLCTDPESRVQLVYFYAKIRISSAVYYFFTL